MTETLEFLLVHPKPLSSTCPGPCEFVMDVLAEVLRVIRVSGAVFLTAQLREPWSLLSPPGDRLAKLLNLQSESCVEFHIVAEGTCWVSVRGQTPIQVQQGDLILLLHGDEHILSSPASLHGVEVDPLIPPPQDGMIRFQYGGKGRLSRMVCGYLRWERKYGPLLSSLPPLLCVKCRHGITQVLPTGDSVSAGKELSSGASQWLEKTLDYMIEQAQTPGGGNAAMLSRMTELLFVEVLRQYMEVIPEGQSSWLAAVKDQQIGRALQALHAEPARSWTVSDLAHAAGISRSGLAERFTSLLGVAPMQYLTNWRMHLACDLLREPSHTVAAVALRVGYDSEAAFSRAFKRHLGTPPAVWRKSINIAQPVS